MHAAPLFPDSRLAEIHRRLLEFYGKPAERVVWDPLKQFIYSLLSSRTKTEVTYEVVEHLQQRFSTWETLRDAPIAEIEDAIRPITFCEKKAVQLKQALEQITQRCGKLSLDFLHSYRTEKIRAWLEQFDGVGAKTSGAVVNFSSLRRKAMCIDSHHLRLMQRLGLTPKSADAYETEKRLMAMAPEEWDALMLDEHHVLIKTHGQRLCTATGPRCARCPLLDLCPTGAENVAPASRRAKQMVEISGISGAAERSPANPTK